LVPDLSHIDIVDGTPPFPPVLGGDSVYRADLLDSVTSTVRQIEAVLRHSDKTHHSATSGLAFAEEPDGAPAYQDAYEWKPVAVRVIADTETGYIGDGEVWR
jgi:isocitrate lyase